MNDINKDGIIDEKDNSLLHAGRCFTLTLFAIITMIIMAVFDKGISAFPYIIGALTVYCSRSVGQDISSKLINRREN